MPRKYRKPKAHRTPFSLSDLSLSEELCFLAGWHPPTSACDRQKFPRWLTWAAYLSDYLTVRDDLIAQFGERTGPADFFAERAHRFATDCGLAALDAAPYDAIKQYGE